MMQYLIRVASWYGASHFSIIFFLIWQIIHLIYNVQL